MNNQIPKFLITAGIVLIVIGLVWMIGGRYLKFGKLPGDIVIEKENFSFYFPIVTCLVISAVLTLISFLVRWFTNK